MASSGRHHFEIDIGHHFSGGGAHLAIVAASVRIVATRVRR
jgi:hypothetical protein